MTSKMLLKRKRRAESAAPVAAPQPPGPGAATVLVVEDDPSVAALIAMIFRLDGLDVISAFDGAEAVYIAGTASPDLILMDVSMPGVDGITACQLMRTCEKLDHVPLLFLTADHRPEVRSSCVLAGATDCLTKPFDIAALLDRVHELLDESASRRKVS